MFDKPAVTRIATAVAWIAAAVSWLPLAVPVFWFGLSIAAAITVWLARGARLRLGWFDVGVASFCAGAALASLHALRGDESHIALRSLLAVVLASYLARAMPGRRASALLAAGVISLGLAVAAGVVVLWASAGAAKVTPLNGWLYVSTRSVLDSRWTLPLDPANLAVAAASLLTPLAFALVASTSGPRVRGSFLIAAVAFASALVVLSVRSAWVAVLGAAVVYGLRFRGRALRAAGGALAAALTLFVAAAASAPTLFDPGSTLVRVDLWRASVAILQAGGPVGLGPGMFPYHLIELWRGKAGTEVFTGPDNALLQVAGDAGVLGLAGAAIALFAWARRAWDAPPASVLGRGALFGLLCYLAFGAFWSVSVVAIRTAEETFATVAVPFPWLLLGLFYRETDSGST